MRLEYRLPNLVVGTITRAAVRNAISNGVRAEQIIQFLSSCAHVQLERVPDTVKDQIRSWEQEDYRLETAVGVMIGDFPNFEIWKQTKSFCEKKGGLIWSKKWNEGHKGYIFVNDKIIVDGKTLVDQVKAKLRRVKL